MKTRYSVRLPNGIMTGPGLLQTRIFNHNYCSPFYPRALFFLAF